MTTELIKVTKAVDLDGLEFYTLDTTGEAGMSQSALGTLCGVNQSTISRLIDKVVTSDPLCENKLTTSLKPWASKRLTLVTNSKNVVIGEVKTGNLEIYKSDFCFAVITHYAFKGIETAQDSMMKFGSDGIKSWIQNITNYVPKELLEPADPNMINITAWSKYRERGKARRCEYQQYVMNNGGNIAQWTNWTYNTFFGLDASEIREAMEKVRGSQAIARNYLAYTRHLNIVEHFEFMVIQMSRINRKLNLEDLHKAAAKETYEKFKQDNYCLI